MEKTDIRITRSLFTNVFKKRNLNSSTAEEIVANFLSAIRTSNTSAAMVASFHSNNIFLRAMYFRQCDELKVDTESPSSWNIHYSGSRLSTCMGGGKPDPWIEYGEEIGPNWPKCFNIAYCRTFEGWKGAEKNYWEPDQDFIHFAGAHLRDEHKSYCRFDHEGKLHLTFHGDANSAQPNISSEAYVSEADLGKYLPIAGYNLIQFFDISYLPEGVYGLTPWPEGEVSTGDDYSISLHRGPENYFEARGFILHKFPIGDSGLTGLLDEHWSLDKEDISDISLVVHNFRHHGFKVVNASTVTKVTFAKGDMINYFEAENSDAPFELSPAFFSAEVLARYLSDPDKFEVDDSSISCRNAWHLKFFGVNSAGQIFAYPCDLKNLPRKELEYWSIYNVVPKASISENALKSHFFGQWQTEPEPVRDFKQWLRKTTPSTFLDSPTEKELSAIKPVFFESRKEWSDSILALSKATLEKLNFKELKKLADRLEIEFKPDGKSIVLAEAIISCDGEEKRLSFLRFLAELRNKTSAHSAEKSAERLLKKAISEHESLRAHLEYLTTHIQEELDTLIKNLELLERLNKPAS